MRFWFAHFRGDTHARHRLCEQGGILVVYDLVVAAATESGLLFAIDAKARVGGFPLPLCSTSFIAKGHITLSRCIL